ncbi:hypothetical protein ACSBR1_034525 [Camellia fascicularis]
MISSSSIKVELTSPIITINSNQNEVSGAVHLFDHNEEDVKKKRGMDDGCCSKDLNSEIVSPCPPKGVEKVINELEKTRQSSFLIKGKGSFQQNGQGKNCVKSLVLHPHSEKVTIKENGDVEDNKQKRTESSFVTKKKIDPFSSTNMKGGEENLNKTYCPRKPKEQHWKPVLLAAQKRGQAYKRRTPDNTWKPPRSPFSLLQEDHAHDPWRVLVICMLLNWTTGVQAGQVISELFSLCPNAKTALEVATEEIEKVIQTLGLQRKRAVMIHRFSQEYLGECWTHVTQPNGVGK